VLRHHTHGEDAHLEPDPAVYRSDIQRPSVPTLALLPASHLARFSLPRSAIAAAVAVVAAGGLWLALQLRASTTRFEAGLVFADDACQLSPGFAAAIGGPISNAECVQIERLARAEVAAAFEPFRLDVTNASRAFWVVSVRPFVPARSRTVGAAGASLAFGPLGGRGTVGLMALAGYAVRHAPHALPREALITALGRGVGRSVVHEFTHQIAGGQVDGDDPATYEYGSVDRAAQYYGTLHWGAAGERIRERLAR
jgi:hypothetical protein